jgi:cytochrome c biogenesis protein CcdA
MPIGSVLLAFVAGGLSILSPCVLPILPVVLGAAASEHKFGPVALAAGLAISFVIAGLFLATIGYSVGFDGDVLRYVAAALIVAMGAVLILPLLQARLAVAGGPIASWTDRRFGQVRGGGLLSRAVGSGLEPVRRPDARNRLTSCRSRP